MVPGTSNCLLNIETVWEPPFAMEVGAGGVQRDVLMDLGLLPIGRGCCSGNSIAGMGAEDC